MITAIIVDDEPKSVFTLKSFIEEHCTNVKITGTANSARSAKELIETVKPQLVLLDIEMPMGSGFDLLQSLNKIDFEIIFITAYNQYAISAFRFSALDYLLKPLRISQLMEAVDKAIERIAEKNTTRNYELLLQNMAEKDPNRRKLLFTDRGQQFQVPVDEIMYIIAEGNYCHTHTSGKVYLSAKKLKDFEDMLPTDIFCRIHHGHIINMQYVASTRKTRGGTVTMKDGKILEIAVRRKDDFMKMFDRN